MLIELRCNALTIYIIFLIYVKYLYLEFITYFSNYLFPAILLPIDGFSELHIIKRICSEKLRRTNKDSETII